MVANMLRSSGTAQNDAAQVSVSPYPWTTGQHMATLRNFSTWGARGAPPLIMILTLPPSLALTLLKMSLSMKGAAVNTLCPAFIAPNFLDIAILYRRPATKLDDILAMTAL